MTQRKQHMALIPIRLTTALGALALLLAAPLAHAQGAAVQGVANETGNQLENLVTEIITRIPLWITAIIVAGIALILARMVKSAVENKMSREGFEEEHKEVQIVAGRAANATVLIIGITIALKIAGLDLTAVIAAGAFGLGFAMQDFIMNFIAGVMILTARHYTIGDIIKINGTFGRIVEIQSRATVLKAFNGTRIVVPNAELFKNQVTSFTSNPFRRVQVINGVGYESDLKKVKEIVLEAIRNTPKVLAEPKPSVWFYEWGDWEILFKANAWVESRAGWVNVRTDLIMNIEKALNENNVDYPYPIQTLYLEKGESMTEGDVLQKAQKNAKVRHVVKSAQSAQPSAPPIRQAKDLEEERQVSSLLEDQSSPINSSVPPAPVQPINPESMDGETWLKKTSAAQQEATPPTTPTGPSSTPASTPESTPPTSSMPASSPESTSPQTPATSTEPTLAPPTAAPNSASAPTE